MCFFSAPPIAPGGTEASNVTKHPSLRTARASRYNGDLARSEDSTRIGHSRVEQAHIVGPELMVRVPRASRSRSMTGRTETSSDSRLRHHSHTPVLGDRARRPAVARSANHSCAPRAARDPSPAARSVRLRRQRPHHRRRLRAAVDHLVGHDCRRAREWPEAVQRLGLPRGGTLGRSPAPAGKLGNHPAGRLSSRDARVPWPPGARLRRCRAWCACI